jgi:hypothetical protein
MILVGIWWTAVRPMAFRSALIGLLAALLLVYLCPLGSVLSMDPLRKAGVSVLLIGTPIMFASIAFSLLFSRRKDVGAAFGWNLLGAVLGGLLEQLSMVLGLKSLILLAMVCYLCAALLFVRSARAPQPVRAE